MSAIPITPEVDDDPDAILRRTGAHAIPIPGVQDASVAAGGGAGSDASAIPTGRFNGIPSPSAPAIDTSTPAHKQAGVASLWAKADNIHNPVLRVLGKIGAGLARGIDVAGSVVAPGVAAAIPGSTLNTELGENRERRQASEDIVNQQKQAVTAGEQENTREAPAKLQIEQRKQDLAEQIAGQPKPKEEEWSVIPNLVGPNGEIYQQEKNSGQIRPAPAMTGAKPAKQATDRPDTPEQQFIDEYMGSHRGATVADAIRSYSATTQKPEREPKQMVVAPDGTVIELHPGDKVPAGSKTAAKYGEPTADEQRRADLAQNLNENFAQLEDIVTRRPELFGPFAGRWTELKSKFGSDDADIGALATLEHQIGMAQISAHGMRSAHGIDAASQSILNSLHSSPKAILGAINAARKSVATFSQDVENAKGFGPAAGDENEPPRPANVPQGYIFKANGPKGKGWYRP